MQQVIVIVGPTASGKTGLAVQLAQRLQAPIVNADSRQVYKELDIAVAKPTPSEQAAAPHHLLSYISIHEPYSAGQWARDARSVLEAQFSADAKTCIVSGGAGLHVKALVDGIPEMPQVSAATRAAVEQVFAKAGLAGLRAELAQKDPAYLEVVDQRNAHRLMRALAVIRESGQTFTELRARPRHPLPYQIRWVILEPERQELYARINSRVNEMIAEGLEEEAQSLYPYRRLDALNTIGYKEWWPYFEGHQERATVIEAIKQHSRQYARRQLTWNRKLDGLRLSSPDVDAVLAGHTKPKT